MIKNHIREDSISKFNINNIRNKAQCNKMFNFDLKTK